MLVLSRKKNESIIINDNITVTVIEIRGDKVRLGIEAPKDVTVHRREVYEAIQNQARATDPAPRLVAPRCEAARPMDSLLTQQQGTPQPRSIIPRGSRPSLDQVPLAFIKRTNSLIQGPLSGQPRTVTRGPSTTTSRLTNSAP